MINWPNPSYVGEIYTSPLGASWVWNGYAWNTLGGTPEGGNVLFIEIQPDPSVIRELPGQSFELIPAPGVGKYLDIIKIICESSAEVSPATSAYNYVASDFLYFSYTDQNYLASSNYIGSVDFVAGSLWTGNLDSFAIVVPYSKDPIANIFNQNSGLNVGIDNANNNANNATIGDHLVTFKIFYRINDLAI
jgi:hypothetical protein